MPVIGLGIGIGKATVLDRRSLREVRVRCEMVRLVARRVCVVARSHGVEDRLHRVTLPGGVAACGSSRRSWGGPDVRHAVGTVGHDEGVGGQGPHQVLLQLGLRFLRYQTARCNKSHHLVTIS